MKIILDGSKPRYETDDGEPLPVGVAGFSLAHHDGHGTEATLVLDMVKVRAMMRPRVCLQLDGELVQVDEITLTDGRKLAASDLLQALADR
jgi:hypothetical protein